MEENDVKSTWDGNRLEYMIKTHENFLSENLTAWKIFYFKIWDVEKILFKIWTDEKVLIGNLTRCKSFESKSDALYFLNSQSNALFFVQFKVCHVVKLLFQNEAF